MTLRWRMMLIILVGILGCSSTRNIADLGSQVEGGREKKDASLDELLRLLESRYEEIDVIKALVSIEVDSNPPSLLKSFEGELIYARPKDLRIRGFDPLFPRPFFDFIARGEDFQFHSRQDGRTFEGNLNDLLSMSIIEGSIKFIDLLDVMGAVGVPFIDPSFITALEKNEDYFILYLIILHGEKGRLDKKIWIDRADSQVKREEIFDPSGARRMMISFDDYRSTEGIDRPYMISAEKAGFKIKLHFREIKINPQLNPEDFDLKG